MTYVATAIKMKHNCYYSYNLLEIDQICLNNSDWYKKEVLHNHVKNYPGSIKVGSLYGPDVIPAVSGNGEKYVKSAPNDTPNDNLLKLPRSES